jgi:uncharacterized membrane protein
MKTAIISYASAFLSMLIIDVIWLYTMSKRFYTQNLGHLMAQSANLIPAIIFYLIYILGLVVLVILPAIKNNDNYLTIFFTGALLGLVAYSTYDLTNQSTLKDWPLIVTIVDLIWGTLLTGVVATVTVFITRLF